MTAEELAATLIRLHPQEKVFVADPLDITSRLEIEAVRVTDDGIPVIISGSPKALAHDGETVMAPRVSAKLSS